MRVLFLLGALWLKSWGQEVEAPPVVLRSETAVPLNLAIQAGDVLSLSFEAKPAKPGTRMMVRFEPSESRFSHFLNFPLTLKSGSRRFQFPFAVRRDIKPEESRLVFTLRGETAPVEISRIVLSNYGKSRAIAGLPVTSLDYEGREPGARWRSEAWQRIQQHRMAPLAVTVTNAGGQPLPGVQVAVRLRRHSFGFGTAVGVPTFHGSRPGMTSTDQSIYRGHLTRLFNRAVIENHLKWPQWSISENRPQTLETLDWLKKHEIDVRGHVLVWPSWNWTPVPEALAAKNDPAALANVIRRHIQEEADTLAGRIFEWDVLNEPYTNHDFMDILGREAMVDWFQTARNADRRSRLYINDFSILSGNDTRHQDHYFDTVRYLLDSGAPLDGIGFQGHFGPEPTPPEEVLRRLDRFATFGRSLQITEFDMDTPDEFLQAEYTRDFLTAVFSHPSVTGFLMWGFWEGSHWKPNGAMFRRDWSRKPNAYVYEDLVLRHWWTQADLVTDSQGLASLRGFLGDYDVIVSADAVPPKTVPVKLTREGTRLSVVVP